ncbi:MAG: hypothetical protein ACRELG_02450 [Gemmataceae bacterium]
MSEHPTRLHNKNRRRAVLASVGLLAALVAGGIVFALIERVREAVDRAH